MHIVRCTLLLVLLHTPFVLTGCSVSSTSAPSSGTSGSGGSGLAALPVGCTELLTGSQAFTDYTQQNVGICRQLQPFDLPAPFATSDVTNNPAIVARASGQMPHVPSGFKVTLYASGLSGPRYILAAANGDIIVSQQGSGSILVLRGVDSSGAAISKSTYTTGLDNPYGMAFYPSAAAPQYLYVACQTSVLRYYYTLGDISSSAAPATLVTGLPSGGHITRSIAFTRESTPRMLIGVGSSANYTNTDTSSAEFHRANVLAYTPAGVFQGIFASGTRNPVGLAVDASGHVWIGVNERDGLGDNLSADYVTRLTEGGFYGWPWYYNGPNPEPRLPASHPELAAQTIVGDVLLQPHFAPLQINFYTGTQFPTAYQGNLFVASHGSWNKSVRGGYEVLRAPISNGAATGVYEDFMTGFVNSDGKAWGRPAGVAVGADGALYVADDTSNTIWRITYTGQ